MATIALIAHDGKKEALVDWVMENKGALARHTLTGTGTTGGLVAKRTGLPVARLLSGPLGGDAQISAKVAEGKIDAIVFFVDPMTSQPHDVDIKSLIRLAILYDCPLALNPSTASQMIVAQ